MPWVRRSFSGRFERLLTGGQWWHEPQPTTASHDGGCAVRSRTRMPCCTHSASATLSVSSTRASGLSRSVATARLSAWESPGESSRGSADLRKACMAGRRTDAAVTATDRCSPHFLARIWHGFTGRGAGQVYRFRARYRFRRTVISSQCASPLSPATRSPGQSW